MVVLDASAAVELLVYGREGVAAALVGEEVHVPAHFDAEVFAGVRRALRGLVITPDQAELVLLQVARFSATRVGLWGLLAGAYTTRDRFSPYDAFYAVLARQLPATLVTADARFARACEGYVEARLVS